MLHGIYTFAVSSNDSKRGIDEKSDPVRGCNEKVNVNGDFYFYRIQCKRISKTQMRARTHTMLQFLMAFVKRINIAPQFTLAIDQKMIYDKRYADLLLL